MPNRAQNVWLGPQLEELDTLQELDIAQQTAVTTNIGRPEHTPHTVETQVESTHVPGGVCLAGRLLATIFCLF
jgi:hypothetical protein